MAGNEKSGLKPLIRTDPSSCFRPLGGVELAIISVHQRFAWCLKFFTVNPPPASSSSRKPSS